jgi:alkaline phosphatase
MSKLVFVLAFLSITLIGCQSQPISKSKKPENVILMIGDGMGPGQINLLYHFLKNTKHPDFKDTRFAFERMSQKNPVAISVTNPHDNIVTDSACSATQLATGRSSRSGMIGLDYNGNPVETILEKAQKRKMLTGLVSDTRLTHATPASFAAHVTSRNLENEIASQMLEVGPDVLLSGGARHFTPQGTKLKLTGSFKVKSKRTDKRNLLLEAHKKGYQVIHNKNQLQNINKDKKLLIIEW